MRAKKIDHVGIVVKDLNEALATYTRNFGFAADHSRGGDVAALGIKNAFMPVGETGLEFIEPTTTEGPSPRSRTSAAKARSCSRSP
jgi:catechol 2,3-dioxygenase-like lactoylglutathione lyase family enzyme